MNKTLQVLLSGSEGFVGSAVRQQLSADTDYVLTTVSRRPLTQPRDRHFVVDLDGASDCQQILQNIDVVIHTAARVHMMNDQAADPLAEFRRVNTDATLQLARQAAAAGVKRFIFLSSIKVMGETHAPGAPFSSKQQPVPVDPYGLSKFEAEQGLLQLAKTTGMEVVIIRPPLVYGPGVKANFQQLIALTARQWPLPIGAVRNQRSMVALANLVDLIVCCIRHPAAANEVFLVSDGRDLSTPELVRAIAKAMAKTTYLLPIPPVLLRLAGWMTGRSAVIERLTGSLQLDISHTRQTLNWQPPSTIEEELQRTVTFYQSAQQEQQA
jgi:nucleoside-diphosphate-sugar epimerase